MCMRYYLNEIPVVYSCETIQNDFQKMLQGSIRKYMVRNASKTMNYIFLSWILRCKASSKIALYILFRSNEYYSGNQSRMPRNVSYAFTICCMFNIKGSFGKWKSIPFRIIQNQKVVLLCFLWIWWMPQGTCQWKGCWRMMHILEFCVPIKKESKRNFFCRKLSI